MYSTLVYLLLNMTLLSSTRNAVHSLAHDETLWLIFTYSGLAGCLVGVVLPLPPKAAHA